MYNLIRRLIIKLALNFIIRKIFRWLKTYVFEHHIVLTLNVHIDKRQLIMIIIWEL